MEQRQYTLMKLLVIVIVVHASHGHALREVKNVDMLRGQHTKHNAKFSDRDLKTFKLELAQVITRHGARTPLNLLPGDDVEWLCPTTILSSIDSGLHDADLSNLSWRRRYISHRERLHGNCSMGELTQTGILEHIALGSRYRKRYVTDSAFLPASLDTGKVYIRSTDVPRTQMSAQSFLAGLYPTGTRSAADQVITVNMLENGAETMFDNYVSCPILAQIMQKIRSSPEWTAKQAAMGPLAERFKAAFKTDNIPGWGALRDVFSSRLAHGKPLPEGVTLDMVEQCAEQATWELRTRYTDPIIARLGIGRFIYELVLEIQRVVRGEPGPLFLMYSGHDTTLALLLGALSIFEGRPWPPYAANLLVELLSSTDGQYFVRLEYNEEEVELPGCKATPCPLNDFIALTDRLIPTDYTKECTGDAELSAAVEYLRSLFL